MLWLTVIFYCKVVVFAFLVFIEVVGLGSPWFMPMLSLAFNFWLDVVLVDLERFMLREVLAVFFLLRHDVGVFPVHICLHRPHVVAVMLFNLRLNHWLWLWFRFKLLLVDLGVVIFCDKPWVIPLFVLSLLIGDFDGLSYTLGNIDITHVFNFFLFLLLTNWCIGWIIIFAKNLH